MGEHNRNRKEHYWLLRSFFLLTLTSDTVESVDFLCKTRVPVGIKKELQVISRYVGLLGVDTFLQHNLGQNTILGTSSRR